MSPCCQQHWDIKYYICLKVRDCIVLSYIGQRKSDVDVPIPRVRAETILIITLYIDSVPFKSNNCLKGVAAL